MRVKARSHVPAGGRKHMVAIFEKDEIVRVFQHRFQVGRQSLAAGSLPQALRILQFHVENDFAAKRGALFITAPDATDPAVSMPQPDVKRARFFRRFNRKQPLGNICIVGVNQVCQGDF